MTAATLRDALRRQPFHPFRLQTSSGAEFTVNSPEWMMVTDTTTAVGIPGQAGDGDRLILIDNFQINHIETLPLPAASTAQLPATE